MFARDAGRIRRAKNVRLGSGHQRQTGQTQCFYVLTLLANEPFLFRDFKTLTFSNNGVRVKKVLMVIFEHRCPYVDVYSLIILSVRGRI
ncbi:hypothetical protein BT69DRAFT_1281171 [Atractiella rhizophila]|nr:hypothetical protein BT69DRAFT_1281171 [Atractiella rhizophila]